MPPHGALRRAESETVTGRDLGDEYLFYSQTDDKVHILNDTAREIYLLCDGARTLEEIAGEVASRYDVDRQTALDDTVRTIGRLVELGLIES